MEPDDLLDQVNDNQTFLRFARELMADRAASPVATAWQNVGTYWQNDTIEDFLAGAIGWAEDTNFGISQGLQPSNPWKQFAVFLYCGKIYE